MLAEIYIYLSTDDLFNYNIIISKTLPEWLAEPFIKEWARIYAMTDTSDILIIRL